jgi:long-chain alkane monooxygenase
MQTQYAPGTLREKLHRRGPNLPDHHPARVLREVVRKDAAQPAL